MNQALFQELTVVKTHTEIVIAYNRTIVRIGLDQIQSAIGMIKWAIDDNPNNALQFRGLNRGTDNMFVIDFLKKGIALGLSGELITADMLPELSKKIEEALNWEAPTIDVEKRLKGYC